MAKKTPILIFECANAHGGDLGLLKSTVEKFAMTKYAGKYIKFQPFHPDRLALPDFSYHGVYQELFFEAADWKMLISQAFDLFDGVWLDMFDLYGIEIFEKNISKVAGIKLQASVLENNEVISALKTIPLADKKLMVNISGHDISAIDGFLDRFSVLNPSEIILQMGYQSYPTKLEDTGLQKIRTLRAAFPGKKICLADHSAGEDDMSGLVPLLGIAAGCNLVEKHICLDRSKAKYDHYSALEPLEMQKLADRMVLLPKIMEGPFIPVAEQNYLQNSIQIPIAERDLPAGSLVAPGDVIFRRTAQSGDNFSDILRVQEGSGVLSVPIEAGLTIKVNQMRSARVGVIVACRMKSSRLKEKATTLIVGQPSVERCLESCLRIPVADLVVLATSTVKEDGVLENFTLDGKVKFWRGDPNDVIKRYLGACEAFDIDIIMRVTADCPIVSSEIAQALLEHHLKSGADYTAARKCAAGSDVEVFNREALQRVIDYMGAAEYSEYMTCYFQNNKHIFKTEIVDLPPEMVRDYRLTLDYPEDLEMFSLLYEKLQQNGLEPTLKNIFEILDNNSDIANINGHMTLVYETDKELIEKLNRVTKIKADGRPKSVRKERPNND